MPQQTTIWPWNGTTAEPLMAHSYGITLDTGIGVRVEGQDLKVREKQDSARFSPPVLAKAAEWIGLSE